MKVAARVLDYQSNMDGEKIAMSIDQGALSHIMSVLTDLYSDPEMAVLREYSTNAFDAHVEARETRPIEIQLPTALSPFLKIKDFGVGLNAADIRDIYSRYGTSTKRASNDVVGMLGLGCKSALTYADQFTLSGIKDGKCVQVSISRDEDGAGSMTLVANYDTDEPSGVEVIIPARSSNSFAEKAQEFFQFWTPGTVLVNGEEPKRVDGIWVADDLCITQEIDNDVVVMGNVAYPMPPDENMGRGYKRYHLVAFVDIGAVQFTPSRESLHMTSTTKATLAEIRKREVEETNKALAKFVADAPTHSEAIRLMNKFKLMGLSVVPKYRGEDVPAQFDFSVTVTETNIDPITQKPVTTERRMQQTGVVVDAVKNQYRRDRGWNDVQGVPSAMVDSTWVTGYDSDAFTPYKRQKLEKFCEEKKITRVAKASYGDKQPDGVTTFIFVRQLPEKHSHWIDPKNVLKWEDIKAVKIEREKRSNNLSGRPTGAYDAFVAGESKGGILASELKPKLLFWAHSSTRNSWGGHPEPYGLKQLLKLHPTATVVTLGENRIEKFKRDFPTAQNLAEYLRAKATEWADGVSFDDRMALAVGSNYSYAQLFKQLPAEEIADPELVKLIGYANAKVNAHISAAAQTWRSWKELDLSKANKTIDEVTKKYALLPYLTRAYRSDMNDVVLYVNAAYAARKEG